MSDEKPFAEATTEQEIIKTCQSPDRFNIVCMLSRPGATLFMIKLEYTYFIPGTDANNDFLVWQMSFDGLPFFLLSIPANKKDLAYKVAGETGMKISDGIPILIGGGTEQVFPVRGDNTFTLTNHPDSPAYAGFEEKEAYDKQCREKADAIIRAHDAKYGTDHFA
mgnify:CR=1 FL=1|tara:strand:+ start:100954 stop:101448 length:495 start_codon:yes stop_codon:yes gene_type:complete